MKLFRVVFVCTLFLLAALSTSAAPVCEDCDEGFEFDCRSDSSLEHQPCRYTLSGCENYTKLCFGFTAADSGDTLLLSEWTVASIEIENELTKAVATPAAVAQAGTPHLAPQQ
jgi:hypothetical protein